MQGRAVTTLQIVLQAAEDQLLRSSRLTTSAQLQDAGSSDPTPPSKRHPAPLRRMRKGCMGGVQARSLKYGPPHFMVCHDINAKNDAEPRKYLRKSLRKVYDRPLWGSFKNLTSSSVPLERDCSRTAKFLPM